ncbi:MAG TPA: heterodisulfide reductase-related iron-sulfur binding cluster [Candidatus Binatia bacterium]|nr:heterodisulfide reductase-related iron-sulfur binding cluster [Candidatus Binatia bacterium]
MTHTDFVDPQKFFDCVHCGLCLSFCPTYVELGTEMDSPRGRIATMRSLHEGRFGLDVEVVRHLDSCLGCRACETACPSGVHYGELIEGVRPFIEQHYVRPLPERLKRWAINTIFPNPLGMRLFSVMLKTGTALGLGRLARSQKLPQQIRYWFGLLPEKGAISSATLLERYPAIGEKCYTVALLSGCVMPALFGATNQATVKVLRHNGCDVLVPKAQGCCGALLLHNGEKTGALDLARHNIEVFSRLELDALIINAAGCGAMMKEYSKLFKDDPTYRDKAERLAAKMKDVAEFLSSISLKTPTREIRAKVAYHDACHLAHGQGVREQPRALLRSIPGLQLTELQESDWCCGSAGTYNLTEPAMARRLLTRKVDNIQAAEADLVVTGNPGCLMQIRAGLQQRGLPIKAVHTVDLLAEAYEG